MATCPQCGDPWAECACHPTIRYHPIPLPDPLPLASGATITITQEITMTDTAVADTTPTVIEHPDFKPGSSAAKFLNKATEQEWEVAVYRGHLAPYGDGVVAPYAHNDVDIAIVATRPVEPPTSATHTSPISRIVGIFESDTGKFQRAKGSRPVFRSHSSANVDARDPEARHYVDWGSFKEIIAHLTNGPRFMREAAQRLQEKEEAEQSRRNLAECLLEAAGGTLEIERWKTQVAHDLKSTSRQAESALHQVVRKAQEALAAIKAGERTATHPTGVFGSQSVQEALVLCAERERLIQEKDRLERLFGPCPEVTW